MGLPKRGLMMPHKYPERTWIEVTPESYVFHFSEQGLKNMLAIMGKTWSKPALWIDNPRIEEVLSEDA